MRSAQIVEGIKRRASKLAAKISGRLDVCNRCKECVHRHRILPQYVYGKDLEHRWILYCFRSGAKIPAPDSGCNNYEPLRERRPIVTFGQNGGECE